MKQITKLEDSIDTLIKCLKNLSGEYLMDFSHFLDSVDFGSFTFVKQNGRIIGIDVQVKKRK